MPQALVRKKSLTRIAVFCLGTSALTLPALSASFSVGGGTINTTNPTDTALDETSRHYGFTLNEGANSPTDAITITNVTINDQANSFSFPFPNTYDSIFVQGSAASIVSVTMHGSSLTAANGIGLSIGATGATLNTTGGAANVVTSYDVSSTSTTVIMLGPDTINVGSTGGQGINALGNSIAVDMSGGSIVAPNGGISAAGGIVGGNGAGGSGSVAIGGQNGGIQTSITSVSGYGIGASNIGTGSISITLGSNGIINGKGGIIATSSKNQPISIDVFGSITAGVGPAIFVGPNGIPNTSVTLESGSTINGSVQFGSDGNNNISIFTGANISNASFMGVGFNSGTTLIDLKGAGNGTFDLSKALNITALQKDDAGVWTIAGTSTYFGGTTVNAGILQLSAGSNLPSGGRLAVNGGTFDLNGRTQTVGALSGTGGAITLGSGSLITNSGTNTSLATVISGTGSLTKTGSGTLTLTGANTYSGGTTVTAGTVQIGNGGTTGSVAGNVVDNSVLAFNRSDAVLFGGVISGTGAVSQLGSGSLTLSGTNTYSGTTTVGAGTLNVTGAIASSAVTVQSGATLTGTGKVGATTIANGGTLTPGSSTAPGALTVAGNLTLASGSNYFDSVMPAAAGLTSVSGAAGINGTLTASLASGAYTIGQRYTVLTAGGGVSGTFAALNTVGIPTYVKARLSYDANDVYLNLDPNALAPLTSNTTGNQHNVVAAIDTAVTAGGAPSGGFLALYGLTGAALNSAIDQISGQAAPNVSNTLGQSFLSFLSMTGQGGSDAGSFAPGNAYGAADAPHRAQLAPGATRVWGALYGGHVGLSADAASGAAGLSASDVGMIGGVDMEADDGLLIGLTAGLGRQSFTSGNGTGDSGDLMIGAYARKDIGPLTVSGAFGYGRHQITTLRVVTIAGTDVLQGKQDADDFGGRLEAGWRTMLDDQYALTPYVAVVADSFESPAYGETALSGASTFALSYAAHSSTLGRSELGARLGRNFETDNGTLSADLQGAWAHQLDDAPFTQATFQGLPGASFAVTGVRAAADTALLGADVQMQNRSGLFFGMRAQAQLGAGTTIVEGMGNLGWRW